MANETEVELAVRGARRSFDDGRWSKKNINDRREVLKKLGSFRGMEMGRKGNGRKNKAAVFCQERQRRR
jgi:hypothetical protein